MNDLPALTLAPADLFRRAAAWLIDVLIVGLLFVIPFAASLPRIEGCTWDAEALTFPDECVFKTSRMVERDDGTTEQVYVFDDGQEISASTPTLQTAIFGEFIISSSPGPAAYLIPFFYILAVWIGVQGLLGFTPGKSVMGLRLANEEGRAAGLVPAFIRWLVIDGGIGLLGLLVALVNGPTFVRFLAANGALGLIGGIYALVTAGRRTGDHAAHTLVIDETLFRRPERPERPDHDDATGYDQPSSPDQLPTVAASTTDVPAVGAAFGTAVGATSGATAFGDTGSGEDADQDRSPRLTPRRRSDQPEPVQPAPGWGDPAPAVPIPIFRGWRPSLAGNRSRRRRGRLCRLTCPTSPRRPPRPTCPRGRQTRHRASPSRPRSSRNPRLPQTPLRASRSHPASRTHQASATKP